MDRFHIAELIMGLGDKEGLKPQAKDIEGKGSRSHWQSY